MTMLFCIIFLVNLIIPSYQLQECLISKYEDVETVTANCTDITIGNVVVPAKTTLRINLIEGTRLTLKGNISFEFGAWDGPSVLIDGSSLTVVGEAGSVFDGQGDRYWDGQGSWGSLKKPKLIRIAAQNSIFENINILNCPIACVSIKGSNNLTISNWTIDNFAGDEEVAPPGKFGHNTDGFQIGSSSNLTIKNSVIYNQDDCAVINSGSRILIEGVYCHGGHGLSISAGSSSQGSFEKNSVTNITFRNCTLVNGENAIHIKTHTDAGNGTINGVVYDNIKFEGQILYGINIQQNYENLPANSTMEPVPVGNIPIVNLTFTNIVGVVDPSAVPVYIICADGACLNWTWNNVNVTGSKPNDCNFDPNGYKC